MADELDQQLTELADGENRLADLFRQVTTALDELVGKARRLGGALDGTSPSGSPPAPTAAASPGNPPAVPASPGNQPTPSASPEAGPAAWPEPGGLPATAALPRFFTLDQVLQWPLSVGMPAAGASPASQSEADKADLDNTRANQRTADAVEELVRNGIKIRDLPPAVYSE